MAILKKIAAEWVMRMTKKRWALLGLNQRPSDYESDALTN